MAEVYKTGPEAAKAMMSKPVTVRANQVKEKFFGKPRNSEEADDVLFAIQAFYGDPKIDYEEAANRFTEDEVKEAVDFVKKKGYNKFTHFSKKPQEDASYDAFTMQNEPEDLEKLENEWGWK